MPNKYVGQRVKRTEDPRLIKGLAHYVDDIGLPGTLHVAFVRSVFAHAQQLGQLGHRLGIVTRHGGSEFSEEFFKISRGRQLGEHWRNRAPETQYTNPKYQSD